MLRLLCVILALLPFATAARGAAAVDVAIGDRYACALYEDGAVWCWGTLPGEKASYPFAARKILDLPPASSIDAGATGACAVARDGNVWCWGLDVQASMRAKAPVHSRKPVKVEGLPAVSLVQIGYGHLCALARRGEVWCWGENTCGELGCGDREVHALPVRVSNLPPARAISTGVANTCVVLVDGQISCWGSDNPTSPGQPFVFESASPLALSEAYLGRFVDVANGRNFVCGIRESGEVTCWGSLILGQLGTRRPRVGGWPGGIGEAEGIRRAEDIDATNFAGCAVEAGRVKCWGAHTFETLTPVQPPRDVPGIVSATRVAVGPDFACAIAGGRVLCWGGSTVDGEVFIPGIAPERPVAVPGLPQ